MRPVVIQTADATLFVGISESSRRAYVLAQSERASVVVTLDVEQAIRAFQALDQAIEEIDDETPTPEQVADLFAEMVDDDRRAGVA